MALMGVATLNPGMAAAGAGMYVGSGVVRTIAQMLAPIFDEGVRDTLNGIDFRTRTASCP